MPAHILIIEDNPTNLELMLYLLNAFGYKPASAANGEDGLAAVHRVPPDLIVCDIHLPGMDGYEIAFRLKKEAAFKHIPLIAVTALAMVGDHEKILKAGFDGYITKPIDPQAFVSQVETYLHPDRHSAKTSARAESGMPQDALGAR